MVDVPDVTLQVVQGHMVNVVLPVFASLQYKIFIREIVAVGVMFSNALAVVTGRDTNSVGEVVPDVWLQPVFPLVFRLKVGDGGPGVILRSRSLFLDQIRYLRPLPRQLARWRRQPLTLFGFATHQCVPQ